MYTLLEHGLDRVDINPFLENVQNGLKDHYDIKMLSYLMTARLAAACPNSVLLSKFRIFLLDMRKQKIDLLFPSL